MLYNRFNCIARPLGLYHPTVRHHLAKCSYFLNHMVYFVTFCIHIHATLPNHWHAVVVYEEIHNKLQYIIYL